MNCSFGFSPPCKYYKITFTLSCLNVMPMFIKLLQYRLHYNLFCLRKFSTITLKYYYFLQQLMSFAKVERIGKCDGQKRRKEFLLCKPLFFQVHLL